MGKLIVQSSEFAGQEFNLAPGRNSVGRNPGNLVEIPHSSISGQHGELEEDPNGWLTVRDLGSTNGTACEGQQVAEAFVSPGETFQLGDVLMLYTAGVAPTPVAEAPVDPPAEEAKPSGKPCQKHSDELVSLICPQCKLKMCERCVNQVEISGKLKNYCPTCKQICTPLKKHKKNKKQQKAKEERSFWKCVPDILKYPLRGSGLALLSVGAVCSVIMDLLTGFSFILILFFLISTFGYLFAYMQKIILTTANGDEDLPTWPDLTEVWQDLIYPCFIFLWTFLVCFAPPIIYEVSCAWEGRDINLGILFPLYAWGFLYFPMALLAVAMTNNFLAVNPLVVLPSITRLAGQYAFVATLFFLMVGLRFVVAGFVGRLGIPFVSSILSAFIALYFLAIEMRMLGMMYYLNRHRLKWFKHHD
ncbi:MAG: FHA domain-containing protein [Limisphaerales bacterium]